MGDDVRLLVSVHPSVRGHIEDYKKATGKSQKEIVTEALQNYFDLKVGHIRGFDPKRARLHHEMLSGGEHVILDVDHWNLFLNMLEQLPDAEMFWEVHRRVARAHAEKLVGSPAAMEDTLRRLEACNFFNLRKVSEKEFTLIMNSLGSKRFIQVFLEEVASGLGFHIRIKEDITKLRIEV